MFVRNKEIQIKNSMGHKTGLGQNVTGTCKVWAFGVVKIVSHTLKIIVKPIYFQKI